MSDEARGVALVVAGVMSAQFGAGFAVTLFDELGAGGAAFVRLAVAAVVLLAIWRPRPPTELTTLAFGAALGIMNFAIYSAMDRIPMGIAVTIEFAGPLAVAVIASRRRLDLLWVALAAGGIVLLTDPGGGSLNAAGIAYAVLAAAMWALYIPLSARTGRLYPGGSGLAAAMVVGAVLIAPVGIAQGGGELLRGDLLAAGAGVALASSVIPYTLDLEALRRLPARVFGVLMSLDPAVAALAGLIVLGQSLGVREWIAIVLVVVASAGATAAPASAEEASTH